MGDVHPRKQRRDRKTTYTLCRTNSLRNTIQWCDIDLPAESSVSSWNYLDFSVSFLSVHGDSRGTNNQPGKKHVTCHGAYGTETAEEEHILYRGDLPYDTSHLAASPRWYHPPASVSLKNSPRASHPASEALLPEPSCGRLSVKQQRCSCLQRICEARFFHQEVDWSQITLSEICIWPYWSARCARSTFPFSSSGERRLGELHTLIKKIHMHANIISSTAPLNNA